MKIQATEDTMKTILLALVIGACHASTSLVLSQDEEAEKKQSENNVPTLGKPQTSDSPNSKNSKVTQQIEVLDNNEAKDARLKVESVRNFVPREEEWKWPDSLVPGVAETWQKNYRGSFSFFDRQGNALVPAGDFNTIIVTRTVDAGYDSREDPLLLVGQLLVVPESERKTEAIPHESELKGFLVSPVASALSALGQAQGYFSARTNSSGQQELSVWFKYEKAGAAKFLFYAPPTQKDFTLFVLKQKPVRFSLRPRK